MDQGPYLDENLALFGKVFPDDAKKIKETETSSVSFAESSNGLPNLTVKDENDELRFLHNKDNPLEEAYLWTSSLPLNAVDLIFIYGVGLGYYYDALESWLETTPYKNIIFIEDNPEVLKRFFQTEKASKILKDSKVRIYYIDDFLKNEKKFSEIALFYAKAPFKISALNYYLRQKSEKLIKLNTVLEYMLNIQKISASELEQLGYSFFINFFQNLIKLPESKQGSLLFNAFKGIPAIICGAGPSLDKNIHLLKNLKDKAIIIAGGTAMNVLNKAGLIPHFGMGIDPNPDQTLRILTNEAFMTPYFYKLRMNATALNLIHGDLLYLNGSHGYKIAGWFEKELGLQGQALDEGYNVINASFELANALGCSPLVTVGVDLAYSGEGSYAKLTDKHPLTTNPVPFKTKTEEEELLSRMDIHDKPVMTLWKWLLESVWYSRWVLDHPKVEFVNATEGGIGFPGVLNPTLAEVSEKFLTANHDLDGLIHLGIQNAPMEKEADYKHIEELLLKLKDSLKACRSIAKKIKKEFQTLSQNLAANETAVIKMASPELLKLIGELNQEIAYEAILESFNDYFNKIFEKEFQNLAINDVILGKHEVEKKKLHIHSIRYQMLEKTSDQVANLIESSLSYLRQASLIQQGQENKLEEIESVKKVLNTLNYISEGGHFTIQDPDCDIHIQESYEPALKIQTHEFENGKITYFQKNESFHGASSTYFKNGQLASRIFYFEGKKIGKAIFYYPDGSLYAIHCYKEGKRIGKQLFFYPTGVLRAEISYDKDVLNGDVLLYYPNGQLKRKLSYKNGLKNGDELLLSPRGFKIIEAQYEEGKPKGSARYFDLAGTIIKEVHFDNEGKPLKTYSEIEKRNLIEVPTELKEDDYFDTVTRATKSLTSYLEVVSQRLALFLSASLDDKESTLSKDIIELREMLDEIKKNLDDLRVHEKELEVESGISSESFKEPIWKSPSSKRLLNAQVMVLTEELEKRLIEIEKRIINLKKQKQSQET